MSYYRIYLAALFVLITSAGRSQIITSVAGNGITQFIGDGSPATSLSLAGPFGIYGDKKGRLYIADFYNNRIRRLSHDTLSTVAGKDTLGYSGDGGAATLAKLNNPNGVFLDTSGSFFITDAHNNVLRKVDGHTLIISTICGSGVSGFAGDGAAATTARIQNPGGPCVDSVGNVYFPDCDNHRIRRVDAATGDITTIAGTGTAGHAGDNAAATLAQLNYPNSICIDRQGSLYFTERGNHDVRKIDASGIITTVAGTTVQSYTGDGGPALNATMDQPNAVFVDRKGYMYISDYGNNVVRMVTPAGIIRTLAGTGMPGYSGDGGPATAATFRGPASIYVDDNGFVFIGDGDNSVIRKITPSWSVGIAEVTQSSLLIYPNPSSGRFSVRIAGTGNTCTLEIVNMVGQAVYKNEMKSGMNEIDISGYPHGIYYAVLISENFRSVQKLVLQ